LKKTGPICRTFSTIVERIINRRDRKDRGEGRDCISLLGHDLDTFFSAGSACSVVKNTGYAVSHLPSVLCLPSFQLRQGYAGHPVLCSLDCARDKLPSSAFCSPLFCLLCPVFCLLYFVNYILYHLCRFVSSKFSKKGRKKAWRQRNVGG
jgi:hypothetical protein